MSKAVIEQPETCYVVRLIRPTIGGCDLSRSYATPHEAYDAAQTHLKKYGCEFGITSVEVFAVDYRPIARIHMKVTFDNEVLG